MINLIDLIALIVITAFVPLMVFIGAKLHSYKNYDKLLKAFAITLLAVDLFRFFYNAKFYANATTPANELRFSYLTIYSVIVMFSAFSSGNIKKFFSQATLYTALIPIVIGVFNPKVFVNALDTHAVLKALYFIESGIAVLVAILCLINNKEISSVKSLVAPIISFAVYFVFYSLAIHFWNFGYEFNLTFLLTLVISLVSIAVVYGITLLIKCIKK